MLLGLLRRLRGGRNGEASARDSLEEIIEEREELDVPLDESERALMANILSLHDLSVEDVMVPRADIVAIRSDATFDEVVALMTQEGHSRLPVYRDVLDDAIGMLHIKDVLALRDDTEAFRVTKALRRILFVPPSLSVLELLRDMRDARSHMALVVDEFGGVDGLVTIEDLVEQIVGEMQDEHHRHSEAILQERSDGTMDADARTPVELLEERFGPLLTDDERENVDTVGGLVFSLAGHIPVRGEVVDHPSGLQFEILEADPRRIRRLRVRSREGEAEADTGPQPARRAGAG
jgi:CBS domain containing-hemolysin-like protein